MIFCKILLILHSLKNKYFPQNQIFLVVKNRVLEKKQKLVEMCVNLWETDKIKKNTKIKRSSKININTCHKWYTGTVLGQNNGDGFVFKY